MRQGRERGGILPNDHLPKPWEGNIRQALNIRVEGNLVTEIKEAKSPSKGETEAQKEART